MLNLVVVFIDVVPPGYQEYLGHHFLVAAKQELTKTVILLNDPKGALRLDGTVHPKQDAFFACDTF
jgi:hypothetical protein